MEVIKTAIEGVLIIEPKIFTDARGYFFESFSQREFDEKVGRVNFVQDNESKSSYGSDMNLFPVTQICKRKKRLIVTRY